ncbi:mitochondrial ribonuclease P catalytic subunit-like [Contarinia nasturtii]|uniref:mitochondrial ribonuclease P catalytic subunit-like n=1 Tax=Contarinia nasturtii TaxID=265458 RepID=UPI0012D4098F|nr:mitochondrial ribonuclease P catalytic subunit-like [Contarinia nasturtii]
MFVILRKIHFFENSKSFQQVFNYAKYAKQSTCERKAKLEKQQFNLVRGCITSALKDRPSLSVSEFKTIGAELYSKCNEFKHISFHYHVFSVLFTLRPPNDSLENAKNFIEAFDIKNNSRLKKIFIQLYTKKASEFKLTEKEEQELIRICDEFIAQEFHIDSDCNAIIVTGLCATKDWRKAIELPHSNDISLNSLAQKAIHENDIDLAWNILHRLTNLSHDHRLTTKTITAFAEYFDENPTRISTHAGKLFFLCEKLKMLFNEPSIKELVDVLERHGHHAKTTNINFSGVCNVCKNHLEAARTLSDSELNILRAEFTKNVVKGADIYQNTTPDEWDSFERMIQENGPFDIVIDGLNVSYGANANNAHICAFSKLTFSKRDNKAPSALSLKNAVEQLCNEGKRILVIGRTHMKYWAKMRRIRQIATVFFVDNKSVDDLFLLYAALQSGQHAHILSNDYMKQHKFSIEEKYRELFKLWQQEHWYGFILDQNKSLQLVKPMQYKMYIHKVNDFWHLPFKTNKHIESKLWNNYELPENWACIRIKDNVECNHMATV